MTQVVIPTNSDLYSMFVIPLINLAKARISFLTTSVILTITQPKKGSIESNLSDEFCDIFKAILLI
jgi:hypothetical protein